MKHPIMVMTEKEAVRNIARWIINDCDTPVDEIEYILNKCFDYDEIIDEYSGVFEYMQTNRPSWVLKGDENGTVLR